MLNCVYHPVDDMRVVDDNERERLLALGVWFDSPKEAESVRQSCEDKIKNEKKPGKHKVKENDNG